MTQSMNRPGTEVTQEIPSPTASQTEPALRTVVVGLNTQLVSDASAGAYDGNSVALAYPSLELGAIVKLTAVLIVLKKVVATVYDGGATNVTVSADTLSLPAATTPNFSTSGVATGDTVKVTASGVTYAAKVLAVTGALTIKIDRNFPFANCTITVERAMADKTLVAGTDYAATASDITIAAGLTASSKTIASAEVHVSYTAVRQLTANRMTKCTGLDFKAKLGTSQAANPLALGVQCALANNEVVYAVGVTDDSPSAWLAALASISNKPAYSIVLLTDNAAITSMLRTHVLQLSAPVKSRFRSGVVSGKHPWERVVVTTLANGEILRTGGSLQVRHPLAAFGSTVLVGDYVVVTANDNTADTAHAAIYRVTDVVNNGVLELDNHFYTGADGAYNADSTAAYSADFATDDVDIKVFRALDLDGQAQALAEIAESFGTRRMVYVTNAQVEVETDAGSEIVPGFYAAAALAGLRCGSKPHQGFTNYAVSGIKTVFFGHDYFDEDQLGLIAGSGGLILEQDVAGALPTVYYQTTTDTSSIETKEWSITTTFDFYCLGLKERTDKLIGPNNIYAATLTLLHNVVDGYHSLLKQDVTPFIGPVLLEGKLVGLEQNDLEPDTVDLVTDITIPTPLNKIRARVRLVQ